MQELLKEYKDTLRQLEEDKENLKEIVEEMSQEKNKEIRLEQIAPVKADLRIINGMISDLKFAIEWMKKGKRPGSTRGIERRAAYEREVPVDPIHLQNYYTDTGCGGYTTITESEREQIKEALSLLTEREKEIYMMARGQRLPRQQIADLLNVSKGTVNNTLKRCDQKIKVKKSTSFFYAPLAN